VTETGIIEHGPLGEDIQVAIVGEGDGCGCTRYIYIYSFLANFLLNHYCHS
jgi:hypothetical protein